MTESIGALGFGFFKLDDGTGTIWIYSDRFGAPAQGSNTAVTGKLDIPPHESFLWSSLRRHRYDAA